jgi:CheY-like chemotaxis protein
MATSAPVRRVILVVDDHADAATVLATLLRAFGHTCYVATTGAQALELMSKHAPDMAILDIGLPDISGLELARTFRAQRGTGVYLVALTGWGEAVDRQRAHAAGFDRHVLKPIDVETVRSLVA